MIVCSGAAVPGQLVVTARSSADQPASQVVGQSELPIRQFMLRIERQNTKRYRRTVTNIHNCIQTIEMDLLPSKIKCNLLLENYGRVAAAAASILQITMDKENLTTLQSYTMTYSRRYQAP